MIFVYIIHKYEYLNSNSKWVLMVYIFKHVYFYNNIRIESNSYTYNNTFYLPIVLKNKINVMMFVLKFIAFL